MINIINKVLNKENLSEDEMIYAMEAFMQGQVSNEQGAGFLTALKMKGESVSEITGGAKVMRKMAMNLDIDDLYTLDTCGTGGDRSGTFNISTATAFVCAAAGVPVAKHGNRSVSSKSGSADVLEALGVNIEMSNKQVEESINKFNIGFLFAPIFHPAMKNAAHIRKSLGYPTIFNILGPLTNPAKVKAQLIGVYSKDLGDVFSKVLNNLKIDHGMIVHGMDGLDEITTTTNSNIYEIRDNKIKHYILNPEDYGIKKSTLSQLQGGNSKENAQIIKNIFEGKKDAKRDILVLNSGAAIYLGKAAKSLKEGISVAMDIIDSGLALKKLEEYRDYSNSIK